MEKINAHPGKDSHLRDARELRRRTGVRFFRDGRDASHL